MLEPSANWITLYGPFLLPRASVAVVNLDYACHDFRTGDAFDGRTSFTIGHRQGVWEAQYFGQRPEKLSPDVAIFERTGQFTVRAWPRASCVVTMTRSSEPTKKLR